jgi:ankyrin repeat protein
MVRTASSLIGLVLCAFVWPAATQAQEITPRSYLFVEVADAAGEVLADATVRVSSADGKELLNLKTGKNGSVNTRFDRYQHVHHYDLQITKAGYLPYEGVVFPYVPNEPYFDYLTEEIPNTAGPSRDRPLVRITLRETPSTPAEEKKQLLLLAAKRGDAASLRKLLQEGVSANSADAKILPAVAWAAFAGDPETIKLLLDAGANVRNGVALLIYLAEGVSRGRLQIDIVERLIAAGVDVNASQSYQGTVLNKAIVQVPKALTIETIGALIKAGANVNAADAIGQTPLMLAARQNQGELVNLLLNSGAKRSLNAKDKDGRSAFFYAAASGWRDSSLAIVKVLMANQAIVTEVDEAGETPLMMAAKGASNETVQILLKTGASINAKNKLGQTALMYAVAGYYAPNPDTAQTVKLLLANGARINDVDAKGQSVLMHVAPASPEAEVIKLLIANGANVNVIDSDGQTALLLAVQRYSTPLVQALIEGGVGPTVNAKDSKRRTALLYAVDYGREDLVPALIAAGASVDDVNENGQTPLMIAVLRARPTLVNLLLKAGASIDIKDHFGKTALTYARNYKMDTIVKLLEEPRP